MMAIGPEYRLTSPNSSTDWKAYHNIRRSVLFESRGRFGVYIENHPDEFAENNHPQLFFYKDKPIGTVRIDVRPDRKMALIRRLAIEEKWQRKGHGQKLLTLVENVAAKKGCAIIAVNSAIDAAAFYRKCGFREAIWSEKEQHANSVQLIKEIFI